MQHSKARDISPLRFTAAEAAPGDPETLRILLPAMKGGRDVAISEACGAAFALADTVCEECAKDRAKAQRAFAILSENWWGADPHVRGHMLASACLLGIPRTLPSILDGLKRAVAPEEKLSAGLQALLSASYCENPSATIHKMRDMLRHPNDTVGRFAAEQLAIFSVTIRTAGIIFEHAVQTKNRHAASVFLMGLEDMRYRDPTFGRSGKHAGLVRTLSSCLGEMRAQEGVHLRAGRKEKAHMQRTERVRRAVQQLHLRLEGQQAYKAELIKAARKAVREQMHKPKQPPKPVRSRLRLV